MTFILGFSIRIESYMRRVDIYILLVNICIEIYYTQFIST